MNAPESPALLIAVAVTTAAGINPPPVTVEDLVGDRDPMEVVSALGVAWAATLRAVLGDEGRDRVLADIGLAAALPKEGGR